MSLAVNLTPPYSLFKPSRENLSAAQNEFIEYHKWMFDYERYIKLTHNKKANSGFNLENKTERPFVLVTKAHFGYIGQYNQNVALSEFERFSLGGSGLSGANNSFLLGTEIISLRGYDENTVQTSEGGNGVLYNKFVTELRFPVITQGIATIYLLGFAEAGNNWANFKEFNPFNLKRSVGVGARIFMPAFGLLGIDYGYGFDQIKGFPDGQVNRGQFHFIIGQLLR
jgi:outer membrane protein insertion porin family